MKKGLLVVFIALGSMMVSSCSDCGCSESDYSNNIQGLWVETHYDFLDINKKKIGEGPALIVDGCAVDQTEFKDDKITYISSTKDYKGQCREENLTRGYTIEEDKIIITDLDDGQFSHFYTIKEIKKDKLILIDEDVRQDEDLMDVKAPKGTRFIQIVHARVK